MWLILIKVALLGVSVSRSQPMDAPAALTDDEMYTSLTIDQIITKTMGGLGLGSNLVLSDDGTILTELDMRLTMDQFHSLYQPPQMAGPRPLRGKRKAVRDTVYRWTKKEIPYRFVSGHYSSLEEYKVRTAMTEWEKYTCLNFRKATSSDINVVRFQHGSGCNSQLGMVGGEQPLNLDRNGCRFKGLYLHEIGHAIGLVHEHQLPTRDKYVQVLWENVQPGYEFCFDKYRNDTIDVMDVEYEYSSVMHYGVTAFSSSNKPTMRATMSNKEETIGRVYLKQLGFSDVKIVNLMYNCAEKCSKNIVCRDGGFVDQNCRCICKDGTDSCQQGKTTPHPDSQCRDWDDWQCRILANQGECHRNKKLLDTCPKACGACGKTQVFSNTCEDRSPSNKCKVWKEEGECYVNKDWMEENCKKTCKACNSGGTDPETNCRNKHSSDEDCDKWALEGECQVNLAWMPVNCQKSCRMCDEIPTTPKPMTTSLPDGPCINEHNDVACQDWAKRGECEVNPQWMIPNCRKACSRCSGDQGKVLCKNTWDDKQCKGWAADFECTKNSEWMQKNCHKACNPRDCSDQTSASTTPPRVTTATTPGGGGGDCINFHKSDEQCDVWAKHGNCKINKWMTKNCAKSCNSCEGKVTGGVKEATTKPSAEVTTPFVGCVDQHDMCPEWTKHGYCEDNPAVALTKCKRSCRGCTVGETECIDKNQLCLVWAKADLCRRNAGYMMVNCRVSCDAC